MKSIHHHWSTLQKSESHHLNLWPDSLINIISHFIFVIWLTSRYIPIGLMMNIIQKKNEYPYWHIKHGVLWLTKSTQLIKIFAVTRHLDSPPRMSHSSLLIMESYRSMVTSYERIITDLNLLSCYIYELWLKSTPQWIIKTYYEKNSDISDIAYKSN